MKYEWKNLSGKDCAELKDGDIVERCNLAQITPHTVLACNKRKITFRACNMKNVELWPEAVIADCFHAGLHQSPVVEVVDRDLEVRVRLQQLSSEYDLDAVKEAAKTVFSLAEVTATEVSRG